MAILLIWEECPVGTSFHLLPFREELLKLHGKFLNQEDLSWEEQKLIEILDLEKGAPLSNQSLVGLNVIYFVQTGVLL